MNKKDISEEMITFGKYKDLTLKELLKDRKYCSWLLEQEWFSKQYNYLFNRVKEYKPQNFFISGEIKTTFISEEDFIKNYPYFNLYPLEKLQTSLTENDKKCYLFYLDIVANLKEKMLTLRGDIKAPTSWLKKFELDTSLSRDSFKEFLSSYELPNITTIVEDIKKIYGIEYKGAKSFIIAKQKSLSQEKFWEEILKKHYGQNISVQYKFLNCFFDFINIQKNTLYECKIGLKDFNKDQHEKYLKILSKFSLVYLISNDCIIDLDKQTIFTTTAEKYKTYFYTLTDPNQFIKIIKEFPVSEIKKIEDYFL